MQTRDVFVTGAGMVTPLGWGRETTWNRLLAGDRAGRLLTAADLPHAGAVAQLLGRSPGGAPVETDGAYRRVSDQLSLWNSGLEPDFQLHFGHDLLNNMLAFSLMDAVSDAGLSFDTCGQATTGCVIGTSKPSLRAIEAFFSRHYGGDDAWSEEPSNTVSDADLWLNAVMPDGPLRAARFLTQSSGPAECPVAACATGLIGVLQAAQLIRSGRCDVCIAGSADAALRPSVLASFHRLGVLSRAGDAAAACRPFDCDRDGFIIGEGAGVVVLESRQHAKRRHATAYGQVIAGGWQTDPTGMTQIDESGSIVASVVEDLCETIGPPDHIQLHGTATPSNDLAEANGLNTVLGGQLPPCTGVKGAIGHLLGAAGSVEFALSMLSLRDQSIPGVTNLSTPDPQCALPLVTDSRVSHVMNSVLKLSLGFGGHVAGCFVRSATL